MCPPDVRVFKSVTPARAADWLSKRSEGVRWSWGTHNSESSSGLLLNMDQRLLWSRLTRSESDETKWDTCDLAHCVCGACASKNVSINYQELEVRKLSAAGFLHSNTPSFARLCASVKSAEWHSKAFKGITWESSENDSTLHSLTKKKVTLYGWRIYDQMCKLMQIQYLHHCFNVTKVHYAVKRLGNGV